MRTILVTPVLKKFKSSMDATTRILFEFTSKGGDQVVKNTLEVYDIETNIRVYNAYVTSFNTRHNMLANKLTNGKTYKARIQTYNANGDTSEWSEYIMFVCSSIPTVSLSEEANFTVGNQTYLFRGSYSQAEGEELQSYKFILYDRYMTQVAVSEDKYLLPIEYEFTGLDNNENYYIEMRARSVSSAEATTGLIPFYVKYIKPRMNSILKLENNYKNATVLIEANTIQAIFESENKTYTFLENDWMNLATDTIYTDRSLGFTLNEGDWTINLRFKVFNITSNILTLLDEGRNKLTVRKIEDRLFVEYFYNEIPLLMRYFALGNNEDYLNLYIQKSGVNFDTELKIN